MHNEKLQSLANELRYEIIKNSARSKTPHLGSCLSCIDILVVLYWAILNIDPANPRKKDRDRFILSKGHAAPALFFLLAKKEFFHSKRLASYGEDGSVFGEHPSAPGFVPGIEAATGSLGHGLPIGLGMAMATRINKLSYDVFVLLSDGECNEGSVWEAAMMASAQKITNLTVIIDYNKWQATGRSRDILKLDPLDLKWNAFGWEVEEIDGHDFKQIETSLRKRKKNLTKPKVVIANTVKGKGVSFMEDDNNWHYRIPSPEEVMKAKKELKI